jgi:hypothetical protein
MAATSSMMDRSMMLCRFMSEECVEYNVGDICAYPCCQALEAHDAD